MAVTKVLKVDLMENQSTRNETRKNRKTLLLLLAMSMSSHQKLEAVFYFRYVLRTQLKWAMCGDVKHDVAILFF